MSKRHLRSKDIVVLLETLGESRTYEELGASLGMSSSQAYYSIQRCEQAHLYDSNRGQVRKRELIEFVGHGVRYAFATNPGEVTRGTPTAFSFSGVEEQFTVSESDPVYVWPSPKGTVRGESVAPLYDRVPDAVEADATLHYLLAIIDVIRIGSARERNVASDLFEEFILS